MSETPVFSLIVPTRQRADQLGRLLHSLAITAADPAAIEVVLVVDADDAASLSFRFERLALQRVVVAPGLRMGALNMAGYEASTGAYLMLLNDDVIARTRRWDRRILGALSRFPDGIVLVHPNDWLFGERLCTFPIVSRAFCDLAGGICPRGYVRYRIDDHIEDVFNLLWVLGECRTIYLADVVFEHRPFGAADGERAYVPREDILARDAPEFDALFPGRKELALRLKEIIRGPAPPARLQRWRSKLETIEDPFALRVPQRHQVEADAQKLRYRLAMGMRRIRTCVRQQGCRGLVEAVWKRLGSKSSVRPL